MLESGEFLKVGSSTVQRTSVRIVAATNVDLQGAVAQGKFREDLYYRLSTVQIHIPPLRDRGVDIRLLTRKFASDFAERYRMPPISFSTEADDTMRHYRWPGNVRQLKNVVEQLALFEAGNEITPSLLEQYLPSIATSYMPTVGVESHSYQREREMLFGMIFNLQSRLDELQSRLDNTGVHIGKNPLIEQEHTSKAETFPTSLVVHRPDSGTTAPPCSDVAYSEVVKEPETLEDNERETIRRALMRNDGRRKAAADELQISERTLYRKIKEYGLE